MPHTLANRIIQGDCIKVMQSIPSASVDLILTDPPYLVRYQSRDGRRVPNDEGGSFLAPAFAEMHRVLKSNRFCVSFYGWSKVDTFFAAWRRAGFHPAGHIVFAKSYPSSQRFLAYTHEQAYLLAKGEPRKPDVLLTDVLPWQYTGNDLHPTQKPILSLLPLVLAFSQPGDMVLDPFCGSGSALLAAKLLGRRYIGIEIDPDYCKRAEERLQQDVPV